MAGRKIAAGPMLVDPKVRQALDRGTPVVALESAVTTHGLPRPNNIDMARRLERTVAAEGATPATVAVLDGQIRVGLTDAQLARLSEEETALKLGTRDLPTAMVRRASGGTTVGATMFAACKAGITVFATGGIGGVHKDLPYDVSADLRALSDTPMIVVCAGAKAILDLPATLEYLETLGVPVVGFETQEFPAFYSRESGLPLSLRLDSAMAIAEYWAAHRALGRGTAVLVANPIPESDALPREEIGPAIAQAVQEAQTRGIRGSALTPFLLARLLELTDGRSLRANEALLLNNAKVAARIAAALTDRQPRRETQP